MRVAAERISREQPDFLCLHGVEAGDAFATATRFNFQWAYRGGQALFWHSKFRAHEVYDRYLPAPPMRPFERRGLLEVEGETGGAALTLIATQLSTDRFRVREIRFLRTMLRRVSGAVLLFVAGFDARSQSYGFSDLGVKRIVIA